LDKGEATWVVRLKFLSLDGEWCELVSKLRNLESLNDSVRSIVGEISEEEVVVSALLDLVRSDELDLEFSLDEIILRCGATSNSGSCDSGKYLEVHEDFTIVSEICLHDVDISV
jgi:hypothetical protein